MKFNKFLLSLAAFAMASSAIAQDPVDIFNISQNSYSFATARSAAMGGAFTALGADGSSSAINPAGIGMYKGNDLSLSLSVLSTSIESNTTGSLGSYNTTDKHLNVPFNNLTYIQNVYRNDNSPLRSANIGLTLNRTNDYNMDQYTSGNYETTSIGDMFAAQLYGINPNSISSSSSNDYSPYMDMPTSLWGAMMAYNSGLLYVTNDEPYQYTLSGDDYGTLFIGDEVYPDLYVTTEGYKMDYAFTTGINLYDKIYIGASLSIVDYQYSKRNIYSEYANLSNNVGDLDIMDYYQTLNSSGTGFSFKIGANMEVVEGFKLAVAYHAPSIYTIEEEYFADMYSYYTTEPKYMDAFTPYNLSEYRVVTPSVVLLGASLNLGNIGILSFDYDRTFYNSMRVTDGLGASGEASLNSEIKETYKAANNYRAGIEFRATDILYLRGGYAYYGNALQDSSDKENNWQNISGGIGIKVGSFYADLTYINMNYNSSSNYFYYQDFGSDGVICSEQTYKNNITRNSVMFTMGTRF